jgi:hypothetical protein
MRYYEEELEVLIKAGDIDPTGRVSDRTNKKIPH